MCNFHYMRVSSKILGWQITVIMKIYWGDAREKLCLAVDQVPLDYLTIGNRGLGPLQRCLLFQSNPPKHSIADAEVFYVSDIIKDPNFILCFSFSFYRVIMGSVSNYVVNNATCPVTVVKG